MRMIQDAYYWQIITKQELKFISIKHPNIPLFYHLLKIHKDLQTLPGRPIISRIPSITSNLSQYLDIYLQDYVKCQQSHLHDSDQLIKILMTTSWSKGLAFLTMDATSLYLNIDHHLSLHCIDLVLGKDPEVSVLQRQFLLKSLEFILMNNFFTCGDNTYRQRRGTAMGTRVAPAYANLFMGAFEKDHIEGNVLFKEKILVYKWFIDDLFLIWKEDWEEVWKGDWEEAMAFVNSLNNNTWGIEFTPKFDYKEIKFLDLVSLKITVHLALQYTS